MNGQIIKHIRFISEDRCFFMAQRIATDVRLGAKIRTRLGWNKNLPKSQRETIEQRALAMINYGRKCRAKAANEIAIATAKEEKQKPPRRLKALPEPDPIFVSVEKYIIPFLQGLEPIEAEEDKATTALQVLADQLPVAQWWKENVFESTLMLGWLVAEFGDLDDFPNAVFPKGHRRAGERKPAKYGEAALRKRMSVAVMRVCKDGVEVGRVRQGAPGPNASRQDWIDHGYVQRRRSVLSVLGDSLLRNQHPQYKPIYDKRKRYLQERAASRGLTIVSATKIQELKRRNQNTDHLISAGHIHKDAKRYMETRVLRYLLRAWRRANDTVSDRTRGALPAASTFRSYPEGGYELPHA